MLINNSNNDWLKGLIINPANLMQTKATKMLNPLNYHLSPSAKQRLNWLYLLYYEQDGNVTKAASRIGISRPWLSVIKAIFEKNDHDPRSLEPKSRAPYNTTNRPRIPKETENKIIAVRDKYGWGKEKIAAHLRDTQGLSINHNTVNKYLHRHNRISPELSFKNTRAWQNKKQRDNDLVFKIKYRPPGIIKDLAPGALIEKDMKYVPKLGAPSDLRTKDDFWYQQTATDSFTRLRTLEMTRDFNSSTTAAAHTRAVKRFPFPIACENTDNGPENQGEFSDHLQANDIFHFYYNTATPTDNPRVERSHLTDELEFYKRGHLYRDYEEQKRALQDWEHIYNYRRPHQALGYLTPMKFYELWKQNPTKAYAITERWQGYLKRQRKRLAESRRLKRKEQIEALMKFIDVKLNHQNKGLKEVKLHSLGYRNPQKIEREVAHVCNRLY